jgi:hypothetical protein
MHCWIGPRIWDLPGRERSGLVFATNDDIGTQPAAGVTTIEERMVITPYGNVGIGVTSPNQPLEVNGNIGFSKGTNASRYLLVEGADATWAGHVNIQAGFGSTAAGGGVKLYAHSHATYPGSAWIGRSAGAAGSIMFGNGGTGPTSTSQIQMEINSSGIVTKPYQPAFSAYANTNETTAVGGIAPFTALIFDQGSNYTTSTRRFTAPVAGIYQFSTYSNINGVAAGSAMWYAFAVNNVYRGAYMYQVAPTSSWNWLGGTQTIKLAKDDYVQVKSGISMHWDLGNAAWSNFSGHLVG